MVGHLHTVKVKGVTIQLHELHHILLLDVEDIGAATLIRGGNPGRLSVVWPVGCIGVYQAVPIAIKMSDSEASNFSDNESERGSNQQSDSDAEVTEHTDLKVLPVHSIS
jgi:hypothetical protein